MEVLTQIPKEFHSLPFYRWDTETFTINALAEEVKDLLWHQRLIHCGQHSFADIHKHVDGIPNLSKTLFNDLTKCATCLKTNHTKAAFSHSSLQDSLKHPYQSLSIDFGFPGRISKVAKGMLLNLAELTLKVLMENRLEFLSMTVKLE